MAKKSHQKVRLVPESKPDSSFFYYVKKPTKGEKVKKYSIRWVIALKEEAQVILNHFKLL